MVLDMQKISKGTKAEISGYIITEDEKLEYENLKEKVELVNKLYREYEQKYYPNKY